MSAPVFAAPASRPGPAARRRPGAIALIVGCFVASAVIRTGLAGAAVAQDAQLARAEQARPALVADQTPTEALCGPDTGEFHGHDALLAAIRTRMTELDHMSAALDERARTLAVAEVRIEEQLSALVAAERQLADTLALADGAADADVARLTDVYQRMKPDAAARVFETMDVDFAAGFLTRMQPDSAAAVLSAMPADLAYTISVVMAGRNAGAPRQ